jgi:hypothetical protein
LPNKSSARIIIEVDDTTQALASAAMPILPLLKIAGFDATKTLASTFDIAWDVLQRSGSTLAADDNDIVAGGVLVERAKGGRRCRTRERVISRANAPSWYAREMISRQFGPLYSKVMP